MLKVGPGWYPRGKAFDQLFQGKSEIAQIFIFQSDASIYDIQFLYNEDGGNKLVPSKRIGSGSTSIMSHSVNTVALDYPSEFITGISGKYRNFKSNGLTQLISITFHTNKGKHGPFETSSARKVELKDSEVKFSYDAAGHSKFCGFFGTYFDGYIESFGIYVKPVEKLPIKPTVKKESI